MADDNALLVVNDLIGKVNDFRDAHDLRNTDLIAVLDSALYHFEQTAPPNAPPSIFEEALRELDVLRNRHRGVEAQVFAVQCSDCQKRVEITSVRCGDCVEKANGKV